MFVVSLFSCCVHQNSGRAASTMPPFETVSLPLSTLNKDLSTHQGGRMRDNEYTFTWRMPDYGTRRLLIWKVMRMFEEKVGVPSMM